MYVNKVSSSKIISEDTFSSPFVELGLVQSSRSRGALSTYDKRPAIPIELFAYAVVDFWKRTHPSTKTITYDHLLMQQGSPGKVFRLSQDGLNELLDNLSIFTDKQIDWTDTMGLRQIKCEAITDINPALFLDSLYK
jgi:hypothetical protein